MAIREWIIPRDKRFFDMADRQSEKVREGVLILHEMLHDSDGIDEKCARLREVEHEADMIVHDIFHELNKTFITPIDREDISNLTSRLDDIIDCAFVASKRIQLYDIDTPTREMKELSQCLVTAIDHIVGALSEMRRLKNTKEMKEFCIHINSLENQADEIMTTALSKLFKEKDAIRIIQLKEIYECLELATDKCEDVANVINGILIKYG
ncbi:MAG: DUF47 domain-containing protein [Candidatus Altiarchaeota archaeon]|nr:DUF47 domain-containing protein [Candidatus Altiarchaeota archaeon]